MAEKTARNRRLASAINEWFARFAQATARWTGNPLAFLLAVLVVLAWVVTGPIFHYSDTWQLVINTGTTIVTFLMVFLIQNTQNRDTLALQLKLSELVLGAEGVENKFAAVEHLNDEELEKLYEECKRQTEFALGHLQRRHKKSKTAAQRAGSATRRSSRRS